MAKVTIYTTRFCPFCVRAKYLLDKKGADYEEIAVDGRRDMRQQLFERTGQSTVPQIWIGDDHIGGCDDLFALDYQDALDSMLARG